MMHWEGLKKKGLINFRTSEEHEAYLKAFELIGIRKEEKLKFAHRLGCQEREQGKKKNEERYEHDPELRGRYEAGYKGCGVQ